MSTNYAGSGSTVHTTIPLLDDSDRPSALLWRQSFEPIIDSLAALDSGVSSLAIRTTGGTFTLSNDLTIAPGTGPYEWRVSGVQRILSGGSLTVASGGFINVVSGGTIDLDGTLDIGGNSFVRSAVTFTIRAGATLEIEDNGIVTLAGDMTVTSSGNLFVADDALVQLQDGSVMQMQSGSTVVVESGATISVASGGAVDLARARDLTVNSEPYTMLLSLTPAFGSDGWVRDPSASFARWLMAGVSGEPLLFAITAPPGDVINSIVASFDGGTGAGHGGSEPGDPPTVQLVSLDLAGAVTVIAQTSDTTTGAAYDDPHDVVLNGAGMPHTITGQPLYVRVLAEGPTGGIANTTVLRSIGAVCVANSIRRTGGSTEFR